MVVDKASILNIMGGMESTAGVRLHNHRRKLRQRFDIIKKLGQGTYGKVQLGINKETGQEVAIKTIKKSKIESEADLIRIRREIQIMSSVQHPNIIHIYEVFENREKMVLVMEYAAGGELYDFLSERKVLSEEEARRLFRQIATAVYYCHKHKICHRDLKLENILLDENGSAKIADFGLSNVFDETRLLGTFCGSPLYASPEIVQGTPYHGPEVDCWSLGVLLYTLVYGAMPFDGSNFKRLVKQISQGDYFEPKKPSPASPLIRDMLTVSPTKRADIGKICSHWWVNEGHSESCLEIAEHLANQTPVRLDLLLSLAPPMSADKVVVTKDQEGNGQGTGAMAEGPVRSHSVGSLMDLDQPSAERRIRDFVNSTKAEASKSRANLDKVAESSKRKLEDGVSTEDASVGGAKKKERSRSKQRSSRSDRRSSSRSRKQDVMDVEPDVLVRSDSKELLLAAANAISQSLGDSPSADASAEKPQEKRKSIKGKSRVKAEENDVTGDDIVPPEAAVGEGKSGCEPTQEASVPVEETEATDESTKGKVKRKKKIEDQSTSSIVDKLSDASPSDESVRSSQSEPSVEEIRGDMNGVDVSSDGVVSIMSSSTAPVSLPLSDTDIDLSSLDKAKSHGKISLSKILSPSNETPAVPVPTSPEQQPPRVMERRKSKIFETAEKFNNLASTERKGSIVEKPKKIHIPGVKVSDAKAAFERKSSVTSSTASVPATIERKGSVTTVPATIKNSLSKINVQDSDSKAKVPSPATGGASEPVVDESLHTPTPSEPTKQSESQPDDSDRAKKVKEAVGVISSIIEGQVTGRRVSLKKPPKLSSFDSSRGTPSAPGTPLSPTGVDPNTGMKTVRVQVAPNDIRLATIQVSTPQATKYPGEEPPLPGQTIQTSAGPESSVTEQPKKASSSMEITLKSATLPRRKTSKAEIQMGTPPAKAPSPEKFERMIQAPPSPGRRASVGQPLGGYRSEVEHIVGAADHPNRPRHQRSEVSFPVAAASSATRVHPMPFRSASCEPESSRPKPREHIIPIRLEGEDAPAPRTSTPPAKPPVPPATSQSVSGNMPYQRTLSQLSQRSNSLSRQSTQDSDTESTISQTGGEPIRKSPREYIIPIAVEGGGYVTPRATSLEPSEDSKASTHSLPRSRFGRTKRMSRERHQSKFSSLLSESEDEGPFAALHRHSSIGRDSDNEDRPSSIHLHRLRSSRPVQRTLEHTDSVSSAEEEDDDEGFEILTAENLFSSLLSRVRSLTQRLNVEDGGRPGFPSSRLLSQFPSHAGSRASPFMFPTSILGRGSPFEPLSRRVSEASRSFSRNDSEGPTPWRRSVSRDVSDSDSIYSESHNSGTLPRGRSSGDFSESSSLSSYSLTPGLASRLAQYQQVDGPGSQTPAPERRLARAYMKSRSAGVPPAATTPSANDNATPSPSSAPSPSPGPGRRFSSARRAARALEEELNGLDIPSSYLPTSLSLSRSVDESAARRLGIGRTVSMRERPASPSSSYYQGLSRTPRSGLGLGGTTSETHSWERPSSTLSPRRRPYAYTSSLSDSGTPSDYRRSYLESPSEKELPPLPFVSRRAGAGTAPLDRSRRPADTSEEDCSYYEILPYHRKDTVATVGRAEPSSSLVSDSLTRSCPSATFFAETGESKQPTRKSEGSDPVVPSATPRVEVPVPVPAISTPRHYRSVSVTRELGPSVGLSSGTTSEPPSDGESGRAPLLRRSLSSARAEPGPERSILSKLFRPSSSPTAGSDPAEMKPKARRVSRFLRPDFFDTPREESVYAKEKDLQKAAEEQQKKEKEASTKAAPPLESDDKKSSSSSKASSRFLQSLERKLERLRGFPGNSGSLTISTPPSPAPAVSTGRRIESTIRSLREQSLEPKDSDSAPTESSLLKRAVSVSDVGHLDQATASSTKKPGRLFGLFRKDPVDVSKGLIPTFRTQRPYSGSQSDSLVLDSAESTPPARAVGVKTFALEAKVEPSDAVSLDVSIVLPRPGKPRDSSISSRETEAASIPPGPGHAPILTSTTTPTPHPDSSKTDCDLKPSTATALESHSSPPAEGAPVVAAGPARSEAERSEAPTPPATDSEIKRSKISSKSKSSLKEKGLPSSKSKTKVPKLKKDSTSVFVDAESVKCDGKDGELVNGGVAPQDDFSKNTLRQTLPEVENVITAQGKESSSPKKSSSKHKIIDSCESKDIKTPTIDSSRKSISPTKSSSKSRLVKDESTTERLVPRSLTSFELKKEIGASAPSTSNLKTYQDDTGPISTQPSTTLQSKQSDSQLASLQSTSKSKLNGISSLRSASKVKLNGLDNSITQDQPPVKSSSRSKIFKLDDIQVPVKSGSRTKISSVPPVKSSSRTKLNIAEEVKGRIIKSEKENESDLIQVTLPLKSSSFAKLVKTDEQVNKPVATKPPALDKSSSRVKSPPIEEERRPSPTKFVLKQDGKTLPPIRSVSKTKIPITEDKVSFNTKQETRASVPVKSSSRSRITASEEKTIPKQESKSEISVSSKQEAKASLPIKSSSRSRITASEERTLSKQESRSDVSVSSKQEVKALLPVKSSSRSRITASEERTIPKQEAKIVSTSRSSSKSNLSRDKESRISLDSKKTQKDVLPVEEKTLNSFENNSSSPVTSVVAKADPSMTPPTKTPSKSRLLKADSPARSVKPGIRIVKSSSKSGLVKDDEKLTPAGASTSSLSKSGSASRMSKEPPSSKYSAHSKRADTVGSPSRSSSRTRLEGSPPARSAKAPSEAGGNGKDEEEVRSTARALKKSNRSDGESGSPGPIPSRRAASSSPSCIKLVSPSPSPVPSQGSPRRIRARSARPGALRSSSHSRTTASEENVPVVSLKDVERRHREMLLDKWSKSLQTLHSAQNQQQEPKASPSASPTKPPDETKPAKPPRPSLHLDLFPALPAAAPSSRRVESPTESESLDSWSVCSADYADGRDLAVVSPTLSPHSPTTEESESVSDRIRRKSFYCRFNDIKKKKKPSSLGLSSSMTNTLGSPLGSPSGRTRGYSSDYGLPETSRRSSMRRSPVLDDYTPTASRRAGLSPTSCTPSSASLSPGLRHGNNLKYLHNGRATSPLLPPTAPIDRSPTWDKSSIELKNELMFHSLGLHRFDPENLTVSRDRLFEMLSPTNSAPPTPAPNTPDEVGVLSTERTSSAADADPGPV